MHENLINALAEIKIICIQVVEVEATGPEGNVEWEQYHAEYVVVY